MGYERYPQGDRDGRRDPQDYGRDYGSGRDYGYSSARDYGAAGDYRDDRTRSDNRDGRYDQGRRFGGQSQREGYGARDDRDTGYRGSYAHDGRRFENVGRHAHDDDDDHRQRQRGYGRQPQGYDYEERGFFDRAGDEVRSWFGDEDAERRREADARYDERSYRERARDDRDGDYHSWRSNQIAALDRDYDEYRRENRSKFESEFATWRTGRQGQRDLLGKVTEHMDVVGSDGEHVGTVDKVRGDRILLTKNDADAGGRHHSIPSSWLASVDTGVTLAKSAADAKAAWRDEESKQALFGYGDDAHAREANDRTDGGRDAQGRRLNRSFSGTYCLFSRLAIKVPLRKLVG